MSDLKYRFSSRVLSIFLAVMMVVSLMPVTVFAASTSELTTNIGQKTFKVGVPTEFTFSTVANDDAGIMVVGTSDFSDPNAVEKLEYLETKDGKWYEFSGDFGPSTGFPMSDATSTFRVTFKKSGNYSFSASMKKVEDGSVLCSTNVSFTVKGKDKSTLTSNIGEQSFVIGEPTEFTFTTTANDYAGVMVVGTSDFSDESAIEKLEYFETKNNKWYELNGDFGPSTGFPMSDATSRFRVTFKKAGDYTFTASMKYADGDNAGDVLCSTGAISFHVKDKYNVTVEQTGNGVVTLNGDEIGTESLVAAEGETISLAVTSDEGWQISSVSIGGESQTIADRDSYTKDITVKKANIKIEVTFVKVYTVTVDYESTKGAVVTSPEGTAGSVTVETGTTVDITATPNDTYRVTKVEITGKNAVEFSDNKYHSGNPYTTTLTADKDYTVKITFAPLAYDIAVDATTNGTVTVNKDSVEYGDSVLVTIRPSAGFTIDTAKVNNTSVYSTISETEDESVFELTISDIHEDKNIAVSFKECETTTMTNVSWNSSDALRKNTSNNLYVFAKNDKVTFKTTKQGIRVTDINGNTYGDKDTNTAIISRSTTITKIEVRYAFGWHEVLVDGASVNLKLVFDAGKPATEIKANSDPNANGYYNSDITLTISAKDSGDYSGIDYLEYWIVCDGEETEPEKIYTYEDGGEIKANVSLDDIKIVAADNNSANVTVHAKAVDRAGNESEEKTIDLKFCTTVPSVSIKFSDSQAAEAASGDNWYNKNRTATISINDRADVFDETSATNGMSFAAGSANGYSLSDWTSDGNLHTATITFTDEGSYEWSYSYTNKADLDATVSKTGENTDSFKIDKTAPTGTITAQSASWNGEGYDWNTLLEKITFGLYSNKNVSVGLKNNIGSDLLSGFQKVSYYVLNEDEALTESALIDLYESGAFTSDRIEISQDEQFAVYARIVDNAGNVAFIGTNGVIYDLTASDIEIDVVDQPNDNSLYGVNQVKEYATDNGKTIRGIKANIEITDLKTGMYYSGIKKIEYSVSMGTTQTQVGTLYEFKNAKPEKKDLTKEWSGSVIIDAEKNNGKDVTLTVTVTDNAGNESTESVTINEINLDDITSTVAITGKAVTLKDGFGWYASGRTAVINIIDRASTFDAAAATAGIIFEITDNDGNTIAAGPEDVSIGEWNNSGSLHTVTVMFNRDGKYSWHLDYTNKAGNKLAEENVNYGTSESPKAFTIDTTVPHGTVTISGYSWTDKVLSVLTFGLYSKDSFTLEVAASDSDNISPVTTEYYKHIGANALGWSALDSLYNSNEFSKDAPELTGEQQFTVYVRITDNAGNYIYVSSDGHVIDATQTDLDVTAIDLPNENGIYGLNEVKPNGDIASGIRVSVSAEEAESADDSYAGIREIRYEVKSRNSAKEAYQVKQSGILYSFNYERASGNDSNGGRLTITDVNSATKTYDITEKVPTKDMLCREWAGMIVVDAATNNCCDVAVVVYVSDNAGNETSKTINLDVDITAPSISVEFDNNYAQNSNYFNASRTASVVFTERNHHFDQAAAEKIITDSITATKLNGSKVKDAYTISWTSDLTATNPDENTHTATIDFEKDAHYTFGVSYTDLAGNSNAGVNVNDSIAPFDFTVDTTVPTGSVTVNGWTWTQFLDALTFGLYNNSTATVEATGADEISPVTVEYYKSNRDLGVTKVDVAELEFVSYEAFEINKDEQFNVYIKVTDYAGNVTYLNSDGFIVDTLKSAVSVTAVDKANENGVYGLADVKDYSGIGEAKQGVKVHIDVNETNATVNSGIASIEYALISELKGKNVTTQSGTLYSFDYTRTSGKNSNGGNLTITDVNAERIEKTGHTPVKAELRTSWSGDIIVDAAANNSSKVYVRVTVTDNAGNVTDYTVDAKAELALDIDLTAPTIAVSYDNNTALNDKYFNDFRTATIVITERPDHFNAVKATQGIAIAAKNNISSGIESAYLISGWTLNENKTDPDKSTWTATVDFNKDAQYTFAVTYADEANNANAEVNFGKSVAPMDFVVDTPADMPFGTVTVDGNLWNKFLDTITFGLFSKKAVSISATGNDNTSPVTVEYYKSNADTGLSTVDLDALEFVSYEPFEISYDEQFNIYVKVTDYAGNITLLNSDGFIVDTIKSAVKVSAVDAANGSKIYGPNELKEYDVDGKTVKGIKVHIDVDETDKTVNSGIASIKYEVTAKLHGKNEVTQSGTLYVFSYTRDGRNNSNGGSLSITDANAGTTKQDGQVPAKGDLLTSWNGDIVVDAMKNNSSEVSVKVTVVDNAGNESEDTITLDIDLTAPDISISFDNNSAMNEKYFNAQRTATIVITERTNHFDAEKATAGIVITAKDAKGKDVADAFVINGWTDATNAAEPEASTHTATVFFKEDANYTFSVSYADQAANANNTVSTGTSAAPYEFTVDTVDPYGTVTVNDNTWSKFFETLTFGLFNNSKATVSATADDATSPVKIEYYKSNDDFGKKEVDISSLELIATGDYAVGKNEKLFDINKTEQFNVYVRITDMAGHIVLINSDGYIVDTALSPVSVYAVTKANENGIYGISDVAADKGVKLHIDANDTEDGAAKHYSGIKSVSYSVSAELNGKMTETLKETTLYKFENTAPVKSDLTTNWSGDILIDAEKNNSSKVVVTVTVEDNAGNVNTDTIELDINISTPTIDVTFDNNTALNDTYFNASRTATVVITERSNHFNSVAATEGIIITAKDAEGNDVENAYTISGWTDEAHGSNPDAATHTATIAFKADANYTFALSYVGKSGNPNTEVNTGDSVAPYQFTVDTTVPDATISVNDHTWDKILNILTFGLYSRIKAEVKVDATDKTSPITIEYYKTNDPIVKTANALDELYKEGKFETYKAFTVSTNEQFVVYVRITDNAGNYKYISSDGYIVDLAGPNLTLTPDEPNNNGTYNRDVNVKIETTDDEPYSGIAKVEYWVVSKGKETQRQTLFTFDYTREEGENTNKGSLVITDWADGTEKVTNLNGNVPTQAQLYASWTGSFIVDASINDSSDVKVYVGVTDNAGNYTEKNIALDIDITDPVIKVSYDSKANDNAKDGYYTERTATVAITERTNHFDAAAATNGIVITAVDAKGDAVENAYTISSWTTVEGETPDDAVHTAVISYLADANYTFAISYIDKADNENMPVDVSGQKNPYKFTVDKTNPVGTVTARSAEGREEIWSSIVDSLTFGFWSNTKISIAGTSDDATSPIQSVEFYMPVSEIASDNTTVLKKADLDSVDTWKAFKAFDVTENTQFTVYLKITDNAGNYTYIATNGLIVDEEHPVEESVAPEISVSPAKPINGIYKDDVKVAIEVIDPMVGGTYSGLKEVRYAIFDRDSATPDKPTETGILYDFSKDPDVSNHLYPKQAELKQKITPIPRPRGTRSY